MLTLQAYPLYGLKTVCNHKQTRCKSSHEITCSTSSTSVEVWSSVATLKQALNNRPCVKLPDPVSEHQTLCQNIKSHGLKGGNLWLHLIAAFLRLTEPAAILQAQRLALHHARLSRRGMMRLLLRQKA